MFDDLPMDVKKYIGYFYGSLKDLNAYQTSCKSIYEALRTKSDNSASCVWSNMVTSIFFKDASFLMKPLQEKRTGFMESNQSVFNKKYYMELEPSDIFLLKEYALATARHRNIKTMNESFLDYLKLNNKIVTLQLILDWIIEYEFLVYLNKRYQSIIRPKKHLGSLLYHEVQSIFISNKLQTMEIKIKEEIENYLDYFLKYNIIPMPDKENLEPKVKRSKLHF